MDGISGLSTPLNAVKPANGRPTVLELRNIDVLFRRRNQSVHAVRGVSLDVGAGEAVGIVGESGCGKSALALSVLGLLPPSAQVSGSARMHGQEILSMRRAELRKWRGNQVGMVFQDPMGSLNPLMKVGQQITETIRAHTAVSRKAARRRAIELLEMVELKDPKRHVDSYPHELSGGMLQRVMIAIALSCEPSLLIADEPTTALDVTVQAQLLDTLDRLRTSFGMALILITHDLGVVGRVCSKIHVVYAGRIVESGPLGAVMRSPEHPYTMALLSSQPRVGSKSREPVRSIDGYPPSMEDPIVGCSFQPRCIHATDECSHSDPALVGVGDGRRAACIHVGALDRRL